MELGDGGTDASVSSLSQALVSDRDGDGIADASDNCPDVVNANQKNSNSVGPGDACELALVLNQGLLSRYALYGSHKQLLIFPFPVLFAGTPDLLRVTAKAPNNSLAALNLLGPNQLGVASPGQILPSQLGSISGSEILSIGLGQADPLRNALARSVWLRVEGNAGLNLTFFHGGSVVGTVTGTSQAAVSIKRYDASAPFDRVEIRATSGSFSIRGQGPAVMFALGTAQPSCPAGYTRVGSTCVDIDECSGIARVCDPLTTCANTPGSFTCGACPSGYRGTGATGCSDIDECEENSDTCSALVTCSNTAGGYTCGGCPEGTAGNGQTCHDIDECALGTDACDPLVTCTNTNGGYTCGNCPAGYEGGGSTGCADIDECSGPNHGCDTLTTCTNTAGSFTCGACPAGYTGNGNSGCADVDECANGLHNCSPLATCGNTPGGFQCGDCPSGYRGDGRTCTDINECAERSDLCSGLVTCQNNAGGYTCGACPAGYTGDGQTCTDIDECAGSPCDARTTCANNEGGFACSACPAGYVGNGYAGCVDVDECMAETDDCSSLVTCANTDGSFQCGACPAGYAGDGRTCSDVNECQQNGDECSALVTCTNTTGGYTCGACPPGYAGDGYTCTDLDECASAPCDVLTTCSNAEGSYLCGSCPSGYTGDGYTSCLDIDECAVDNGQCPDTHRCVNTVGSRTCETCNPAQLGVSTHCGLGACASTGVTACSYGEVVNSCTPGTALEDDASCNGVDDDCNGAVDEDFAALPTACGVGTCAATGTLSCAGGATFNSCAPGLPATADASCNGLDDDCDGAADEDYPTQSTSCGVGACAATGSRTCAGGTVSDSCNAGTGAANDATCNGLDDDCDGSVDEDFASVVTSCGAGACARTGATSCTGGVIVDSCLAGGGAGSDATCDGVDDDCDGVKDENYVPVATSCGLAQCARTGTSACQNGVVVSVCTPGVPEATIDRTCNGQDDDCDGTADEECIETSCTNTQDDDQDGSIDCEDDDCIGVQNCQLCALNQRCGCIGRPACSAENCDNGVDDDGNGLGDCADAACCNRSAGFCPEFCGAAPPPYSPPHVPVAPTADMATRLNPLLAQQYVPIDSSGKPLQPLEAERAAVVAGKVLARTGAGLMELTQPLAGVKVSILGHTEYGHTFSDPNGEFRFAANGGGNLTFRFEMPGFITTERTAESDFNLGGALETVVMLPRSSKLSPVRTDGTAGWQVVQSEIEEDADGLRKAIVVFEPGLRASVYECDGPGCAPTRVTSMGIRITEFTVGRTAHLSMPGPLPPTSAFTYATDISASDAVAEDGHVIQFPAKVDGTDTFLHRDDGVTPGLAHLYVTNFLDFPEGFGVPVGFYDDDNAFWRSEDNSLVMRMVGVDVATGEARLKCGSLAVATVVTRASNGDVTLDCGGAPTYLTLKSGELKQMTAVFQVNDSFWRTTMTHLSNRDLNAGGVPIEAEPPPNLANIDDGPKEEKSECWGSSVECHSQVLHQDVPVTGTPYSLHYASNRVPGYLKEKTLNIQLREGDLHPRLHAISIAITPRGGESQGINGEQDRSASVWSYPLLTSFDQHQLIESERTLLDAPLVVDWTWNGVDAQGDAILGVNPVDVVLRYRYRCAYGKAARFGAMGTSVSVPRMRGITSSGGGGGSGGRTVVSVMPPPPCFATEKRTMRTSVRAWDAALTEQLGGWTLSPHHRFDRGVLSLGTGGRVEGLLGEVLEERARLPVPGPGAVWDMAVASDGMVFLLSTSPGTLADSVLYRIDPKSGSYKVVADSSACSRPFVLKLPFQRAATLDRNDPNHHSSTGGWRFCTMRSIGLHRGAVDTLYISSGSNDYNDVIDSAWESRFGEIWKVPLATGSELGTPERFAGNGAQAYEVLSTASNSTRASMALSELQGKNALAVPMGFINDIVITDEGLVYVMDETHHGIYQIDQSGVITRIAGTGAPVPGSSGGSKNLPFVSNLGTMVASGQPAGSFPIHCGGGFPRMGIDKAGKIYFIEVGGGGSTQRLNVIDPNGTTITRLWRWSTGTGSPDLLDTHIDPRGFLVSPEGSVFIGDARYRHVRRLDFVDGQPPKFSVAYGFDFFSSDESRNQSAQCQSTENVAQYDVKLGWPMTMAFGPENRMHILERCVNSGNANIAPRLTRSQPQALGTQVPSADGQEIYVFSAGLHRETRNAVTGALVRRFCYSAGAPSELRCTSPATTNPPGLLQEIWDYVDPTKTNPEDSTAANITRIDRSGADIVIEGPFGQRTVLGRDDHGYLSSILVRPFSLTPPPLAVLTPEVRYRPKHDPMGRLTEFQEPGSLHRYTYDSLGRIVSDDGGDQALLTFDVVEETPRSRTVIKRTPELRETRYTRTIRTDNTILTSVTFPDDTANITVSARDGSESTQSLRDGTVVEQKFTGDPALGPVVTYPRETVISTPTATTSIVSTIRETRTASLLERDTLYSLSARTESVTTPMGTTTATYTRASNVWSVASPTGTSTVQLDPLGFVQSVSPAGGASTSMTYARGRPSTLTATARQKSCSHNQAMMCTADADCRSNLSYPGHATATCMLRTSSMGWDYSAATGYLSGVRHAVPGAYTDILGKDYQGRILSSEDPNGNVTSVEYDEEGLPVSVTPPEQPEHTMSYNEVDLSTGYSAPAPSPGESVDSVMYTYTQDRKVKTIASADGRGAIFGYDPTKGSLDAVLVVDPVFGLGGTIDYTDVSPTEQWVTMPDSSGTSSGTELRVRSAGGLPQSASWRRGATEVGRVTYGFDTARRLSTLVVSVGESVTYSYNSTQLAKADVSVGADELLAYNPTNGPAQDQSHLRATGSDWIQTDQKYDANGVLAKYRAGRTSATSVPASLPATIALNAELYGYEITQRDAAGRILERIETVDGVRSTYRYTYDLGGRLTDVATDDLPTAHYEYDANGNRTRRDGESATELAGTDGTNGYDAQDRVRRYDGVSYAFTRAGQLVEKDDGFASTVFKYDMLGNLREVDNGSGVITYRVDGMGRRIAKLKNGVEQKRWTYLSALNVASELDVPTGRMKTFVYASRGNVPDLMVVREGSSVTTYRFATDHLGSVRMVVNAACPQTVPSADVYETCVVWHASYDEYGRRELVKGDEGLHSFGFAGGLWDADTGLVRFGARDYDAQVGRWTARDPILFAGRQTNLYAYVKNDPINLFDPTGLEPVQWCGPGGPGFYGHQCLYMTCIQGNGEITTPKSFSDLVDRTMADEGRETAQSLEKGIEGIIDMGQDALYGDASDGDGPQSLPEVDRDHAVDNILEQLAGIVEARANQRTTGQSAPRPRPPASAGR